ncbi:MAG: LysR family transcriptional regulator [Actinomycetota bacterium]|nr:LysR family transcriptional regulator [Actinomycetota bacterium]
MSVTDANPLASSQLAAFVAAMEAFSVHGAADALDLTQSAVTKRLQALERRLGVSRFDRGRFGVRPTTAGRLLYPEAKQALAALQRAQDAVTEHRDQSRQTLVVAASHTIGELLLPAWLAGFQLQHPRMRAQVEVDNSPGVLTAVREREAQIGFVEGLDALAGHRSLTVHRDEIVVVIAAEHRWARRRSVAAAELSSEPYHTREAGSGTRAVATAALAGAGIELVPTLEAASTQSVKRALAGNGFSLLSPWRSRLSNATAPCDRSGYATSTSRGSSELSTSGAGRPPAWLGGSGAGWRPTRLRGYEYRRH